MRFTEILSCKPKSEGKDMTNKSKIVEEKKITSTPKKESVIPEAVTPTPVLAEVTSEKTPSILGVDRDTDTDWIKRLKKTNPAAYRSLINWD
jgi:hypothetical protein